MALTIIVADYHNAAHAADILSLLNYYALDPMGGGAALKPDVQSNLIGELQKIDHAFSVLAYDDEKPVGLVNCFEAFSTFNCAPLINIHDVVVHESSRGKGTCQHMLEQVKQVARERGCCKVTLEVLTGNEAAKRAYHKAGFSGYELDPEMGHAVFWQHSLN
ncbi:GNAT family N-acetyltransferase [Motilimonas pumila]|uniref:GNAT family N-acetyltransferase n=1 Tax=Motilimonas pumila TaxID=2303987 RepID=A0A418YD35_9GAMM|nr:GNAT family N-acetyltransferase [Motilimonas pumila]RJG42426.1 GNAT family N-acetyltransferase [Motilimonas pumila]